MMFYVMLLVCLCYKQQTHAHSSVAAAKANRV